MTMHDQPSAAATAAAAVDEEPSRRCRRCLQQFACAPEDVVPSKTDFWLCEPCHDKLIGPRSTAS